MNRIAFPVLSLLLATLVLPHTTAAPAAVPAKSHGGPHGQDWHVDDSNLAGPWEGSALNPFPDIQVAIEAADPGDVIKVALGTYGPVTTLGKPLTLLGGYPGATPEAYAAGQAGDFASQGTAPSDTFIEGGPAQDGVTFTRFNDDPYYAILDNFTVRNSRKGVVADIEVSWPHPVQLVISRNRIEDNGSPGITTGGAGVLAPLGDSVVRGNVIRRNHGGRGPGLLRSGGDTGTLTIEDNVIEDNVGYDDHGGGLFLSGQVILQRNVISGNRLDFPYGWGGGVIMVNPGLLESRHNIIRNNHAPSYGGGVFVDEGTTARFFSDLIHNNTTATGQGAGIALDYGTPGPSHADIVQCTIAFNNAGVPDAGVGGNGVFLDIQSTAVVLNSLFHGNGGGDDFFVQPGADSSLEVTYSLSTEPWPGTGNQVADPLLANPPDDFTPQAGSPAINAGLTEAWMADALDIGGNPRVVDGAVDIGAIERQEITQASIFAVAGENGSVSPAGMVFAPPGSSPQFTFTPDPYHQVQEVRTNGVPVGNPATFTWPAVTGTNLLAVTFAPSLTQRGTPHWWLAQFGWTETFELHDVADVDGDGLAAWQEFQFGTNPTDPNTDGDAFDDGVEALAGADPTRDDSAVYGPILAHPAAFGFYTEESIGQLVLSGALIEAVDGQVRIRIRLLAAPQVEGEPWVPTDEVLWEIPATSETRFFRVQTLP